MNLRILFIIAGVWLASLFTTKLWYYHSGWSEGRAALVAEQTEKAQAKLAKQLTRQQADDSKAAAVDEEGKAKTVTITQQVIKYVQTPGRNVCVFDDARVQLKSRAVDNANTIPGYDEAAVQTSAAVGRR